MPHKSKAQPSSDLPPARPRGARRLLFGLAAFIFVPLLFLGGLELALRLFGFGYPTSFLVKQSENGATYLVDNDKFGWRFFPRQLARSPSTLKFPARKTPGTYRIFLFGESAALGDPKPAFSVGRYLEVLLRERFPSAKFEVITVAMTAVNSHAILPIARECSRLEGDFWVVYMGNNEMAGPFGANPLSGPAAPNYRLVRLSLALRATKLGQLVEKFAEPIARRKNNSDQWEGVKMFREHQVAPKDPRKQIVYANFQKNLSDIVDAGLSAGAKPILCTVASNTRDFAPLASNEATGTDPAPYRKGIEQQAEGQAEKASESFRAVLAANPEFADAEFRLGQVTLELAASNSVIRQHFESARNLDSLPLRSDGRLNDLVRTIAQETASRGVALVDIEREIALTLPGQSPGDETFFDHVHYTFAGNYRFARLLAGVIEKNLPPEVSDKRAVNWAGAPICDRLLALTDWNRRAAFDQMMRRQAEPPFTDQSNYTNRIEGLARAIAGFRDGLTGRASTNAVSIYLEALARDERDYRIRESYAEFLEATGKFQEAAEQRLLIARYLPHDSVAAYQAGRLLSNAKRGVEARDWFQKSLDLRPNFPEAHLEIGRAFAGENKHEEALSAYARALTLQKDDTRAFILQAHSLAALNRRKEAKLALREAIRVRTDYWEPRYLLGIELAAENELPEAMLQFQEVTRLRPNYAQAHFNLAVALAKLGKIQEAREEFRKTVELDPEHKMAIEYLGALERQFSP